MTEKSRKIVYIATSVDGFIARENGDIDWLEEDPSYDYYPEFIKNIEVILMGAGIPLFTEQNDIKLELTKVSSYEKGMVQIHYNVIR